MSSYSLSIILPAKNESQAIRSTLSELRTRFPTAEIIVVDDGSDDGTGSIAGECGAKVIRHALSRGNGAAIKSGVRAASGDVLVMMDADGQHRPGDIPRLLERLDEGYDMVVGARDSASQASIWRGAANRFYNRLATYMTGQVIPDLTSGFRAVRTDRFREFLYLLPNGFSYPTTSTMAFFRAGYGVEYVPISAAKRVGTSHINLIRDGLRFFLIILKVGTLYSPLKLFGPVAAAEAMLGLGYYAYTYLAQGRLSLATIFLLTAGITTFLIGLVSEQITQLLYKDTAQSRVSR